MQRRLLNPILYPRHQELLELSSGHYDRDNKFLSEKSTLQHTTTWFKIQYLFGMRNFLNTAMQTGKARCWRSRQTRHGRSSRFRRSSAPPVSSQRGSSYFGHSGRHPTSMEFQTESATGCSELEISEGKVSTRSLNWIDRYAVYSTANMRSL